MKYASSFVGIITLFLATLGHTAMAQTLKEVLNSPGTPVTYLGIDFTQAKVIGETATNAKDIPGYFSGINNVVVNEPKKYDIAAALQKNNINNDISQAEARNKKTDVNQIKSSSVADYAHLKPADIEKLVKEYNFNGKKGLGLLLVMDGMSKIEKGATLYVTFMDMATKKVLLTERMTGKAQGFGFRNYYAAAVMDVLDQIKRVKYAAWKSRNQ